MNTKYLRVPVEMAQFALKESVYQQVQSYLASQFIYSGKARISDNATDEIASLTDNSSRTIHRHFVWLLERNWIGKDSDNGWYFFRGIDFVHALEGWQWSRAAVMFDDDLKHTKEFLIGAVLASIVKTGREAGTDRVCRRSEQPCFPVSLSVIQQALDVSRKTAFTYRNIAKKQGYIEMVPNLRQVELKPADIQMIKQNSEKVTVRLFGSGDLIDVKPDQLRTDHGYVYAQLANLITPNILLKKRDR